MAVHGDDFALCGLEDDLSLIVGDMKSWFKVEIQAMMGADEGDDKEVMILGRIVRWTNSGIEFEADKQHHEILLSKFGLERGSKGLVNKSDKDGKEEGGGVSLLN